MKKRLLKFLFMAFMLCIGNSAWADTETYDFGGFITANGAPGMSLGTEVVATQSGTSEFTGGDLYLLNSPTINGQTLELNNRFAIDYGASAKQQIRFMWRSSSNAYQHGLAGNWNGNGAANTACHLSILNLNVGDKVAITWAVQSGKAGQPYLCSSNVLMTASDSKALNADEYLASGTQYVITYGGNLDLYFKNNNFAISKIVITPETSGVAYTINYKKGSDEVKSVSAKAPVGSVITYQVPFYKGELKYKLADGQATSFTVSEDAAKNVVDVNVAELSQYEYSVSNSLGAELGSGKLYSDETKAFVWAKYVQNAGEWYSAPTTGVIVSADAPTYTVEYTKENDIAYFWEAEAMTASRTYGTIANNVSYSNGAGSGVYAGATLTSKEKIAAGTYEITLGSVTRRAGEHVSYVVEYSVDNTTWIETGFTTEITTGAVGSVQTSTVIGVQIPQEAYIRFKEKFNSNANDYFDYVLIKKAYAITNSASGPGTLTVDAGALKGSTVTLTLTPQESADGHNYRVKPGSLKVTKTASGDEVEVTDNKFTMPEEAVTVSVQFEEYWPITLSEVKNGTIELDKTVGGEGETITITTSADDDYVIESLKYNGISISVDVFVYTFTMPDGAVTVTGTFTPKYPPVNYVINYVTEDDLFTPVYTFKDKKTSRSTVEADPIITVGEVKYVLSGEDYNEATSMVLQETEAANVLTVVVREAPKYAVNISEEVENGTVEADAEEVYEGATVALTATPAAGYLPAVITVTGATSEEAVELAEDGTFVMPAEDVTVSVTFPAGVELSDFAVTTTGNKNEDEEVKAVVSYSAKIAEEFAEDYFDTVFEWTLTDAEGEVVATGEKSPLNITDEEVNIYLPDLTTGDEYTLNIDAVNVWDYSLMDEETFEFPVVFSAENIASVTFTANGIVKEDVIIATLPFDDAENPVMVADGSNGNRGTANYDYTSPINGSKFLNVWGENNNNGFKVATITEEDITENPQWTLEFDWAGYSGCNGKAGQTKLVDLEGNTFFSINDAAGWGNTFTLSTGQTVACYPCNRDTRISANTGSVLSAEYWHHFTVIGTASGILVTVEQYAQAEDGKITKTVVVENAKASATNATPAAIGLRPGSCGSVAIDNLTLAVGDLKIKTYDYIVKFVDQDGNQVKEDETRNAVAGQVLAATDADKETIQDGATQYIYVSDDAAERVIDAADLVLTITYNKVSVADYIVNFVDANGNAIQEPTVHKNAKVGTEVSASTGEVSKLLIDGVFYDYVSGNEAITVTADEAQNAITLVFAPEEGVTGYFLQTYEAGNTDWTTGTSGRYTPINLDGSKIADLEKEITHKEQQAKVDEEGNPVLDEETGEPVMEEVTVVDGTETIVFSNKSRFLTVNQAERNNNGTALTSTAISVDQDDYTFEAKILLGSSNDQAGTTLTVFNQAGDAAILKLVQNGKSATSWKVNDDAENLLELPNSGPATGETNDNLNNLSWYDFKVTVLNGYTFLTVTDEAGNAIFDKKQINTLATSYGIGKMTFATSRYYANFAIDDVVVRSIDPDKDAPEGIGFVAVKINYVDQNGTVLKAADEQKFQVGATIALNSAFTADFKVTEEGEVWTAGSEAVPTTKYIYESDNSADVEVKEGAEVNIVFRGVGSRWLRIRPQIQLTDGTITTKDASGTNLSYVYDSRAAGEYLFEGDVLTYHYPYYLLVDGLLYKSGANGGNEDHASLEIEPGTGNQVKTSTVVWTPATETVNVIDEETGEPVTDEEGNVLTEEVQISNAIFAEESENIEGMTVVKDNYTTIRMANGAAGSALGADVFIATLQPGSYTITSATRSGTTNFLLGEEVVFTVTSQGTVETGTSAEFTVTEATPLYIQQQASTTQYSDYVLIRQLSGTVIPTAIEAPATAAEGVKADGKYLENGKIVIYRGGIKYNTAGSVMQ